MRLAAINTIVICIIISLILVIIYDDPYKAISKTYLESLLDTNECDLQINAIKSNPFLYTLFVEAGLRIPKGILQGNYVDFGNYHQCLKIDQIIGDSHIQGKYCSINVPSGQSYDTPLSPDFRYVSTFNPKKLQVFEEMIEKIKYNEKLYRVISMTSENYLGKYGDHYFKLAVCVPRPCTSEQFLSAIVFNGVSGLYYRDDYCRFPGDKTWSPADIVALVIFSILGVVTVISTTYDISYRFILKKDVEKVNKLYQSFSVYTNGQRLTTWSTEPGTLQCIDGIRVISMLCVVMGHTYTTENYRANIKEYFNWLYSSSSLWVSITPMSVDTFLTLAGVLLVYKTTETLNSSTFIKNIHWFYINRILRINPMLAVVVLLQASLFNQIADGPHWSAMAKQTNRCRRNWWKTLLHIENYVNASTMCLAHSWYLAIDMHLYLVSPLVLYWVLSKKKFQAWISLTAALLLVLSTSTAYIFYLSVPAGDLAEMEVSKSDFEYKRNYYINTLTRASPFFVGMMFGYILDVYRYKKVHLTKIAVWLIWMCIASVFISIIYFNYSIRQPDYDQPILDNIINSLMRPAWGAVICLGIFACVNGYGGPINWFLCLDFWRIPSRLSYAIFLFHYPLMFIINSTELEPVYFSPARCFCKFLVNWSLTMIVAFVATLLVDMPISFFLNQIKSSGTVVHRMKPWMEN